MQKKNKASNKDVNMNSTLSIENIEYIQRCFHNTNDLEIKKITIHEKKAVLVYLATMTDSEKIEKSLLTPLNKSKTNESLKDIIINLDLKITINFNDVIEEMLKGNCALLIEGEKNAYLFNALKENVRDNKEPENEKVVRGSHLGFIESLDVNLNLIRESIKNRNLMIKYFKLGMESNKKIAIIYLADLANSTLIKELEHRIESISMDTVFSPGYIEECIEEYPLSPFPQSLFTQRPDRLEAHLIEGRVAIMTDGSADAIITPITFYSFFQSPDDFNNRYYSGSIFRILRFLSFWIALILPPLYISIVGFHFEIIPFEMVTLVKNSIENVPFPPFFEAAIMVITLELIRESGIRLPTPIGQTIGIVGGLIIGESVVNVGLVSNVMVIVIAITAIMSFSIPSYELGNTVRILSFPIMVAASLFGFVGIVLSIMFIIVHMCKLESFGTPYLPSWTLLSTKDMKDTLFRFPIWLQNRRPSELHAKKQSKQLESREWAKNERD